jgi:choice-of-anchor B domain-containing protein
MLAVHPDPALACRMAPPPPDPDEDYSALSAAVHSHDDHTKDDQEPYVGAGWSEVAAAGAPPVEFGSSGVTLRSWIPLVDLHASATDGNDCWGYTAPSGREYALIGLNTGTAVAEVTDPSNAQVIAHIPSVTSIWRDIKTYSHYAYTVSEGGGGIQVLDLDLIDSGVISDLGNITTGGNVKSHNVAINEESARLYRVGGGNSGTNGLRIYSLANPAVPVLIGTWLDRYCHDTQVVTWTEPPYVGVEVAFCYANNSPGGGAPGLEILDVSDPQNISVIGSINLSIPPIFSHPASFSHQGWLSEDRKFIYFNDEVDEAAGNDTTTRILDVQDLSNPFQAAIFTNSTPARDHNLYTFGSRVYQANYRSGFRILEASSPLAPFEIGHFDTYPPDDNASYNGLWSLYPYFPSGTVIGSDIEKGLFVWTVDTAEIPLTDDWGVVALLLLLMSIALFGALRIARVDRSSP